VYEERREESSAIIVETNSKRDKIQEVITYIEERLDELEGEKEELSAYQKCDRAKRALEYTIYDKELRKAREQVDALEMQRADDASAVHALHERCQATQDDVEAQKEQLAAAEADVDRLERERASLEAERSAAVATRARLEVDVREMEERCLADTETQGKLEEKAAGLDAAIEKAKKELSEVAQPQYEQTREVLQAAEAEEASTSLAMNELLAKQGRGQRFKSAKERDAFLKDQLKGLSASVAGKTTVVEKLNERIKAAAAELKKGNAAVAQKEKDIKARQQALQELGAGIAAKTEQRHELAEARKSAWGAKQAADDSAKAWRDSLQKHERDYRSSMPKHIAMGLEAVAKIVKDEKIQGYYGPLIDNFTLTSTKYRVPVEVAANNALFNVIVEDDAVASRLIAKLSKDNLGRLTFMPLSQLAMQHLEYPSSSDVRPLMKVALRYDPKVERAMAQVFGKKLIARDFDTARQFAQEANMDALTMEGDEVNRKGALEGGFHDDRRSRLLAYAGIQDAKRELAAAVQAQETAAASSLEVDAAVAGIMGEIQREEAKRSNTKMEGGQAQLELKQLMEDLTSVEERQQRDKTEALPAAKQELTALRAQAESFQQELGTPLQQTLSTAEQAQLARLKKEQVVQQTAVKSAQEAHEAAVLARQRLQVLLKDNLLKQREAITAQLSSSSGSGAGEDSDVGERTLHLDMKTKELAQISREAEAAADALRKSAKAQAAAKEAARVCKKTLGDLKSQEAADAEALAEVEKQAEKQLNKRSMLVQKREENLRKIQQLGSLPAAELEEHAHDAVKDLMRKLHKCNQELTKYSHVNKKALDQYVNFSEQREALLERKTELDQGAAAIEELIDNLDRQKDETITRTFRGVSKHFKEVFKELVPQGCGDLVLKTSTNSGGGGGGAADEDGEDGDEGSGTLLSAKDSAEIGSSKSALGGVAVSDLVGVQVKVSFTPAGEVYLMSQLSGGQKALVALSIIFAIQRCDPAPFYLFDELDQALDSTYRAAVAAMIARQANAAQPTQFITTTFRPELVQVASKCYGISLQNKNSNIHALSKGDALSFVADLMNEEEAVGAQGADATMARSGRKRAQAEQPLAEEEEGDEDDDAESNGEEEEDEDAEDDEEEAASARSSKRKGRR